MADIVTVESTKKLYPEVYAAIEKTGFDAGFTEGSVKGKDEGLKAGAESERARIQAVENQLIPGNETLIAELKFDGVTTGPEAAEKVVAAEKTRQTISLANFRAEHVQVAAPVSPPDIDTLEDSEEAKKTPAERMESLIAEKMTADSTLSYSDAFKQVQMENRELAMELLRETRPAQV